jgi:hypothetical protein
MILLGVLLLHDASDRIAFKFLAPKTFCARLFEWAATALLRVAGADNAGSRSSTKLQRTQPVAHTSQGFATHQQVNVSASGRLRSICS